MPGIFRCTKCEHVDHMDIVYPTGAELDVNLRPLPLICTTCHGKPWHNRMTREKYRPDYHDVINPIPGVLVILPG